MVQSWGYQETGNSARPRGAEPSPIAGKIRSLTGSVTVARSDGTAVRAHIGIPLLRGDLIETGADGRVGIAFDDGSAFNLSCGGKIELAEFEDDSNRALNSVLIRVSQGRFAFLAGKDATRGGVSVDTPFATIRGGARSGAICTLTLVTFTIVLLQKLEAASNDPFLLDDLINYKDLQHGTLLIAPKGGNTRGIVLDDPEVTVVVGPPDSGYAVQQISNSPAEMAILLALSDAANATYLLGMADPLTTGSTQRTESQLHNFGDPTFTRTASTSGGLLPSLPNDSNANEGPTSQSPGAPPVVVSGLTLAFTLNDDFVLSHDDTPGVQDFDPDNSPTPGRVTTDTADPFPIALTGIADIGTITVLGRAKDGTAASPFIDTTGSSFGGGILVVSMEASAAGVDSGLKVTGGDNIFLFTETTAGGDKVVVGREGSDGVASENGAIAFIIFSTPNGQTLWMQQSLAIDHGNDGNDFDNIVTMADAALLVRVTVSAGSNSISQTHPVGDRIAFEDDGPIVLNDSAVVQAQSSITTVNALIILDKSGSMGSDSNANSRISLAKAAILDFASQPNVLSIRILPFDQPADAPSFWFNLAVPGGFAALQAFLDPITGSGNTNYEDAIYDAQQTWLAPPNIADLDNVYFISDGSPSVRSNNGVNDGNSGGAGSSAGLTSQEQFAWKAFLAEKGIDNAYAVAIGSGVNNIDLQEVAYPNDANNVIVIDSAGDLSATLQATTMSGAVAGNVINNLTAATADDDTFGADGPGFVRTLRYDSNGDGDVDEADAAGYVFNGTAISLNGGAFNTGTSVTFDTAFGGKMHFDFLTGAWNYSTPNNFTDQFVENFAYTIVDGDGDQSAPASLDITVQLPPPTYTLAGAPDVTESSSLLLTSANFDGITDYNFMEGDVLDLSNLLDENFGVVSSKFNSFVRLTQSGNDIDVFVDANGTGSFGAGAQAFHLIGIGTSASSDPIKLYLEGGDYTMTV